MHHMHANTLSIALARYIILLATASGSVARAQPPAPIRAVVSGGELFTFRLVADAEHSRLRFMFTRTKSQGQNAQTDDYCVWIGFDHAIEHRFFTWNLVDDWVTFTRSYGLHQLPTCYSVVLHRFPAAATKHQSNGNLELDVLHPQMRAHPASGRIPTPFSEWLWVRPATKSFNEVVFDEDGQFKRIRQPEKDGALEEVYWDLRVSDEHTAELFLTVNGSLSIWRGQSDPANKRDETNSQWVLLKHTPTITKGPFLVVGNGGKLCVERDGELGLLSEIDAKQPEFNSLVRREGDEPLLVVEDRDAGVNYFVYNGVIFDGVGQSLERLPQRLSDEERLGHLLRFAIDHRPVKPKP